MKGFDAGEKPLLEIHEDQTTALVLRLGELGVAREFFRELELWSRPRAEIHLRQSGPLGLPPAPFVGETDGEHLAVWIVRRRACFLEVRLEAANHHRIQLFLPDSGASGEAL